VATLMRGDFSLSDDEDPVVLLSAGIGITPVLAMLHHLADDASPRRVIWIHTTRDRAAEAFADEVAALIAALPNLEHHVIYTAARDRLDAARIAALELPSMATVYLCGLTGFMDDMHSALTAAGMIPTAIRSERFGTRPPINPGLANPSAPTHPHAPSGPAGTGPAVAFARSGLTVAWSPRYRTLLEMSEACDVPTRYSCRSGVCHVCETAVIPGDVDYVSAPLEPPASGSTLICCAAARGDLVLDI
jgi:ferredoxin-NADP reductase